jgi:transposase-like protein
MAEERNGLEAALDELLKGKTTEEIVGPNGLLKQLTKALLERAMNAELSHHLGYEKGQAEGRGSGNNRNGKSRKTVHGDFGSVEIAVPRDRNGSFDPQIETASRSEFCFEQPYGSRSCPNTSAAGRASMTRSSRCTPGA